MQSVGALRVYGGLFSDWHHRLIKYIIIKHPYANKTIKFKYFFEYYQYDQNQL